MSGYRCADYNGIQLVKSLASVKVPFVQKAMIAAFRHRFDEAEKLYLENDRSDLAIQLRCKIGDLSIAEELVKRHGCDPFAKNQLWNLIGDRYAERNEWKKAAYYYYQVASSISSRSIL